MRNLHSRSLPTPQLPPDNLIRQPVPHLFCNQPVQRPGTIPWIVALLAQPILDGLVHLQHDASIIEAGLKFSETDINNVTEGSSREAAEDDEFVEAVEEFGRVGGGKDGEDGLAGGGGDGAFVVDVVRGEGRVVAEEDVGPEIAREDDECVSEIDLVALSIGQETLVEDLEEQGRDIAVGFFEFVEEQDGIWFSTDRFCELAGVFVADVAGGTTNEAGDGMFFLKFRHVEADDGGFGREKEGGHFLAEFGFADACG